MRALALLMAVCALAGCSRPGYNEAILADGEKVERQIQQHIAPAPVPTRIVEVPQYQVPPSRITVERVDTIPDSLAYGNLRGIYVIKDSATGKEYIGVSGIGIAEAGDHRSGKTTTKDER